MRQPFALTAADLARDPLDVIGDWASPPAPKRRGNPEHVFQCAQVKQLRLLLPADYIVQANVQERFGVVSGARAKQAGQESGFPDVGIYGDARCWLIENKADGGVLSEAQRKMHARIQAAGIPLLPVCRTIEQAVAFLRENGARFRGALA